MTARPRSTTAIAIAAGALLVACAPALRGGGGTSRSEAAPSVIGIAHAPLGDAIAKGRDLGALPFSDTLHLTLGLVSRDPAGLDAALASGRSVSPAAFATRFGPDPSLVTAARTALLAAGFVSGWRPGAMTMSAIGSAGAADRYFGVRVDSRVGPDGERFYAPRSAPRIPGDLRPIVNAVSGLDDYPRAGTSATLAGTGFSPMNMERFYDVTPLRDSGLDGAGMTVVLVEIDRFDQGMLDAYADKYSLPRFNVVVRQDASAWGDPHSEAGEADLDLEIVHAIAPAAREVVYYASPRGSSADAAARAAFDAYPRGAILTESIGVCETPDERDEANLVNDETARAAAQGWTIFVASGDRGAFGCLPDGDVNTLSTNVLSSVPDVTAVGGTYALFGGGGGYFQESAWGEPLEQWGGGGGLSMFWRMPAWQSGPGVHNQFSTGARQNPDVSADADAESGWDIFALGREGPVGGTSAAAPFWAAITALIDQDLRSKGLPPVGFANPPLYEFARSPAGLPAPAFHDVTVGSNLYYPATPGWDFATGLGSPDVAALRQDFEWSGRAAPAGSGG